MHFILVLALSLLSSCASITTGTSQSITVRTIPEAGATCQLTNNKGTWFIPSTPGIATIRKSFQDLVITCKSEYQSGNTVVKSSIQGMNAGNLVFGGIVGLAVDAGTGGGYSYPSIIDVPLYKNF